MKHKVIYSTSLKKKKRSKKKKTTKMHKQKNQGKKIAKA